MKLIKFEKKNCPKCDMVQNFLNDQEVNIDEKVDVEVSTDLDFISKYVSMSLPVVVLLDDNGELVKKSEGFVSEELEEIVELLN
jgi:glutaredoxin